MSGLSWLGVLVILSFPFCTINHAQPEPNRLAAASAKDFLKSSIEPNAELMADARASDGCPDSAAGARIFQKKSWFQ